jgi:hypothetical protein
MLRTWSRKTPSDREIVGMELTRNPDHATEQLLQRLDHAVYTAIDTGSRVGEISQP